ncbi:MAG: hypothetical protein PHI88_00320 [Candidatus Pacebacteria bacterium]|nr:hypothetical protein [Candidatus Paceibacterota bacterium]
MKCLFIDETECKQRDPNFFGVGGLFVDSFFYKTLKRSFKSCFESLGWDEKKELKGSYLFSSRKGDKNVPVDKRIKLVREIVDCTRAKQRSRINFYFTSNGKKRSEKNYLFLLKKIIKSLKNYPDKNDKNLVIITIHQCSEFKEKNIKKIINENLKARLVLFEKPFIIHSENEACGMIIVDILNYLKMWIVLNPEEKSQLKLFPSVNQKKLAQVTEILATIKNIKDVK